MWLIDHWMYDMIWYGSGKKPTIAKWYSDSKSNFYDGIDAGTVMYNDTSDYKKEHKATAAIETSSMMDDDPSIVDIPPIYSLILFGPPGM